MLLVFRRFSEYILLKIDRQKKKLIISGKSSNYKEEEQPWRLLWDKCEHHKKNPKESNLDCKSCQEVAKQQEEATQNLTDEQFREVFARQMKVYLYELVKWE